MDNYPDTTWGGDPGAPWNQPDPPEPEEYELELNDVEKLAIAQAYYKSVAELVKTRDPYNLRGRVDAEMRRTYESLRESLGTAPKSFDIELFGKKVGTYSITTTKPEPSKTTVELKVTNNDELLSWAVKNGYVVVDMDAVTDHFTAFGEVPPGCEPETIQIPEIEGGEIKSTALRINTEKVVNALGPQLETVTYKLLEGGE